MSTDPGGPSSETPTVDVDATGAVLNGNDPVGDHSEPAVLGAPRVSAEAAMTVHTSESAHVRGGRAPDASGGHTVDGSGDEAAAPAADADAARHGEAGATTGVRGEGRTGADEEAGDPGRPAPLVVDAHLEEAHTTGESDGGELASALPPEPAHVVPTDEPDEASPWTDVLADPRLDDEVEVRRRGEAPVS